MWVGKRHVAASSSDQAARRFDLARCCAQGSHARQPLVQKKKKNPRDSRCGDSRILGHLGWKSRPPQQGRSRPRQVQGGRRRSASPQTCRPGWRSRAWAWQQEGRGRQAAPPGPSSSPSLLDPSSPSPDLVQGPAGVQRLSAGGKARGDRGLPRRLEEALVVSERVRGPGAALRVRRSLGKPHTAGSPMGLCGARGGRTGG